jgi:hypothetical protein
VRDVRWRENEWAAGFGCGEFGAERGGFGFSTGLGFGFRRGRRSGWGVSGDRGGGGRSSRNGINVHSIFCFWYVTVAHCFPFMTFHFLGRVYVGSSLLYSPTSTVGRVGGAGKGFGC